MRKLLIISIHWLGDSFWDAQILPALKERYDCYLVCKSHSKDLFFHYLDSSRLVVCDNILSDRKRENFSIKNYFTELKECRKRNCDLVLDLSGNRYSAIFAFFCGIKKRFGVNEHKFSFLYTDKMEAFDYDLHLSYRPFHILNKFGINQTYKEPTYFLRTEISKSKIALLIPGAGWEAKKWSLEFFAKVGNLLKSKGFKVIISGSPKEKCLVEKLRGSIVGAEVFKADLNHLFDLIPKVSVSIANDSGPGHLLAAAGSQHISLFTYNTEPSKCQPVGKNVRVFQKDSKKNEEYFLSLLESENFTINN